MKFYLKKIPKRGEFIKSNQAFDKLDNIDQYLKEKDNEWISQQKDTTNPFINGLINNDISIELREEIELKEYYTEKYGYAVFGELFITNRYGANVAQTGRTSDYRQDDEQWWQLAKKNGLYIAELRGLWKLEKGFMGGPFVSHTTIDTVYNRVVTIDGYVFAPNRDKRNLIRQVEAIINTLEIKK